jgi:hypothetical protein
MCYNITKRANDTTPKAHASLHSQVNIFHRLISDLPTTHRNHAELFLKIPSVFCPSGGISTCERPEHCGLCKRNNANPARRHSFPHFSTQPRAEFCYQSSGTSIRYWENTVIPFLILSPPMPNPIFDLILSLTPEDGSSIGNGAMLARLQDHIPDLTEDAYATARDALIDDGILARGMGPGGSIYRADVADLTLTEPAAPAPKTASGKPRKKATRIGGPGRGAVLSSRRHTREQPRGGDGACGNRPGPAENRMAI